MASSVALTSPKLWHHHRQSVAQSVAVASSSTHCSCGNIVATVCGIVATACGLIYGTIVATVEASSSPQSLQRRHSKWIHLWPHRRHSCGINVDTICGIFATVCGLVCGNIVTSVAASSSLKSLASSPPSVASSVASSSPQLWQQPRHSLRHRRHRL